jgi:phosphoglycolate phosphatase-like HAD superfamily hydrolase
MELRALADSPPRIVFMDCDGVIFDTNKLKCDAFRYALEPYPTEAVERLVAYHRRTGGVSRYLKFELFFRDLHPVERPRDAMEVALARFAGYCEAGYARMAPRPEALDFARHHEAPVYVVSGSDENELRRVFDVKGIAALFAGVHGSPVGKREHLGHLLGRHGVGASEALFVGDGWGDWDCAQALAVPFIFLAEMSEWDDGRQTVAASAGPMAVAESWAALNSAFGVSDSRRR